MQTDHGTRRTGLRTLNCTRNTLLVSASCYKPGEGNTCHHSCCHCHLESLLQGITLVVLLSLKVHARGEPASHKHSYIVCRFQLSLPSLGAHWGQTRAFSRQIWDYTLHSSCPQASCYSQPIKLSTMYHSYMQCDKESADLRSQGFSQVPLISFETCLG